MGGSNRGWGRVGMRHQASELLKLESRVHQQLDYLSLPFGRGSRVTSRGSRVTSRGSKNSSQLFLNVGKSNFLFTGVFGFCFILH